MQKFSRWWFVVLLMVGGSLPVMASLPGDNSSSLELLTKFKQDMENCQSNLNVFSGLLMKWRQQYQSSLAGAPDAAQQARRAVPTGINLEGLNQLLAVDSAARPQLLHCPGSKIKAPRRHGKAEESRNSYYYMGNLTGDLALGDDVPDATIPLIFDKPGARHVCVLFRDGHVETIGRYGRDRSCTAQTLIQILAQRYNYAPDVQQKLLTAAMQLDMKAGVKLK